MVANKLKFKLLKSVNNPNSIHGIYPYRGKISAIDVQQLISQLPNKGMLLDPFCGSGTILYEARKHGLHIVGVDSNPIAVQIANAKISNFDIKQSIDKIKEIIEGIDLKKKKKMPDKAARFFHEETANQIMHLKEFYDDFNDYEKAAFLGTICLSARGCNNSKWSSTQIGKAAEVKNNIDFFSKFLMKLKKHAHPVNPNNSKIHNGDARKMSDFIKSENLKKYINEINKHIESIKWTLTKMLVDLDE